MRSIFVADTDFTGGIYFTKIQDIALEAFIKRVEEACPQKQNRLMYGPLLFPIVRAEANYQKPVRAGDILKVELFLERLGTTSLTYRANLTKQQVHVANVLITHVCLQKNSGEKMQVPLWLKDCFEKVAPA